MHMMGILSFQMGRTADAERLISASVAINPKYAEGHADLGNIFLNLGHAERALACFDRALTASPGFSMAHYLRGHALRALGRIQDASESYKYAVHFKSDFVEAHSEYGSALVMLGRPSEALPCFDAALKINPNFVPALSNRGSALLDLRRCAEALVAFEEALKILPQSAEILTNRGNALVATNRLVEGLASFDAALAMKPQFLGALDGKGKTLRKIRRSDDAAKCFSALRTLSPTYPDVHGNLFTAQLNCCDWSEYNVAASHIVDEVRKGRPEQPPLSFLLHGHLPSDQLACAKAYAGRRFKTIPEPQWRGEIYRHDKIRVAYLSADFRDHVVGHVIANLFELHDREKFEIYGISIGPDDGSLLGQRLRKGFDRFIDMADKSDQEVAAHLRGMEIDIIVDLNGYTAGERMTILAHRPAPIQVSYLGYPGTSGAVFMDYILADAHVIPTGEERFYSEHVVRLPDTFFVTDSTLPQTSRIPTRTEHGLSEKAFVFACFNGASKISPEIFEVWMRLLYSVSGSLLWLRDGGSGVSQNLRRAAAAKGISPSRLVFAPHADLDEHLARHLLADVFLDTSPYNAHGTAVHALWAGLPLITFEGAAFAGRVASSLLRAIEMPELIAASLEEYEELALKLATSPETLAQIRRKLLCNRQSTPLFDTPRFCGNIEKAYVAMWRRYRDSYPPAGFDL